MSRTSWCSADDRRCRGLALGIVCFGLLLSGCSGGGGAGGGSSSGPSTPDTSADPPPSASPSTSSPSGGGSVDLEHPVFDPATFVDPLTSTNRWNPLRPGMQWLRQGTTLVGSREVPHTVVSTMTDVVRIIDGVPAVEMLDQETDAGQLAQVSIDYFALDKDGNVWIMGGYVEDYSGGVFTNSAETWLGAASGAVLGVQMPANPDLNTPRWFIGQPPGEGGSAAEVVETGASQCVDFACYDNVLVVREGAVDAIDNEFKYYAPDVGLILNSPRQESSTKDTESLANLTQLSDAGLTEMSNEVLRLEEHARETEPDVFATAPEATRAP